MPVKLGVQYNISELQSMLIDLGHKETLTNEINLNGDESAKFYVVDLNLLKIETVQRGNEVDNTDVFVIASNTLNVYYLKGIEVDGVMYFSVVNLITDNSVQKQELEDNESQVTLNEQITLTKNTNVWTNELVINIEVNKTSDEIISYVFANTIKTELSGSAKRTLNVENLTSQEIAAFESNKTIVVNREKDNQIVEQKTLDISNLVEPTLGKMEITNTTDSSYNTIKIISSDIGGSGVKAIYFDYYDMLDGEIIKKYYTDRTDVTSAELLEFGKITKNGIAKLPKNIKSIVAIVVDNAGNMSDIVEYTIDDSYLLSQ